MKLFVLSALSVLSISANAQDAAAPLEPKTSKWVGGIFGGISESFKGSSQYESFPDNGPDCVNVGVGLFARYYLCEHLALETSITGALSDKKFTAVRYTTSHSIDAYNYDHTSWRAKTVEIPLHIQYHFGKRSAAVKPFIGVGLGVMTRIYDKHTTVYNERQDIIRSQWSDNVDQMAFFGQLTQGLTYDLSSRIQFNQILYYQHELSYNRQNIGLRFGCAYKF